MCLLESRDLLFGISGPREGAAGKEEVIELRTSYTILTAGFDNGVRRNYWTIGIQNLIYNY